MLAVALAVGICVGLIGQAHNIQKDVNQANDILVDGAGDGRYRMAGGMQID